MMEWQDYYLWELDCECGTIRQGSYGTAPPDQAAYIARLGRVRTIRLIRVASDEAPIETVSSVDLPFLARPDYFRRNHGVMGQGIQDITFFIGWRHGDECYFDTIDTAGQVSRGVSP